MNPHETIIENFFKTGRGFQMSSFDLEKAIVGIMALMVEYRAFPGKELEYLQGLAAAANRIRDEARR
jgi:hypothetical protein